jgi:hypothetical protein
MKMRRIVLSSVLLTSLLLGMVLSAFPLAQPIYANPGGTQQVIVGGFNDALFGQATEYNCLMGGGAWLASEASTYQVMPTAGTLSSLYVELSANINAGATGIFTIMKNGSAQALTCTIGAGASTGNDTTHSVSYVAGDTISIRATYTGTPGTPKAYWTTLWQGTTAGESICLESIASSTTASKFGSIQGKGWASTEAYAKTPIPTSGTLKSLYVKLSADPGTSPDAYSFTLRLDTSGGSADTALTCTIVADNTTGNDTTHTITVAAGNLVDIRVTPLDTPSASPVCAIGMVFVSDTSGESLIAGGSSADAPNTGATEYVNLCGSGGTTWNATEASMYSLIQACTIKKLYVSLSAAPGSGKSYTISINKDAGAASGLTVTISDTATTGSDTTHTYDPANGDTADIKSVPTSTPATTYVNIGLVCYIAPPVAPTVVMSAATNVTAITATLNGNVTATGGENPTVTVYWGDNDGGQVPGSWDYSSAPTSPSQPQGVAAFYKNVDSLSPDTLYYFSAKATNSGETGWGATQSFTTLGKPVVTSSVATNVEETTATWNGNITSIGGATVDYRGFAWGTTSKSDPGDVTPASSGYDLFWYQSGSYGTGAYTYDVSNLTQGTTWYYRACAHNTYGWDYSNTEQTVYTKPGDPSSLSATAVSTSQIDLAWTTGAGAEKTMVRGKTGSYPTSPTDGTQVYFDTGTSCSDIDLDQGTTHYYRTWAWDTNSGYSDGYSQAAATTLLGELHVALSIQWEYDTTFHDLSPYGNDATPHFRTTSSDADVSATFQNFKPIEEAIYPIGPKEEETGMLTTTPTAPEELYGAEGGGSENIPGAAWVNTLLEKTNIPPDFFWITVVYFVFAAGAVVLSFHFIRSSLLFPAIAGFCVILFFALVTGGNPIPLWTIFPYILNSAGFLVMEKTFGW